MAEGGAQEGEDRTEAATPKRLERAREQGQVPLSREAVGFATLLGATLAAALALPPLGMHWLRTMRGLLSVADPGATTAVALNLLRASALALLPVLAATALAAILATMAQTGGLVRGKALVPDASRLNPLAALKRLFGPKGLAELLKTLMKLGLVGMALWRAVDLRGLQAVLHLPAGALLEEAGRGILRLLMATLAAFALVAALDLGWVRWQHYRQLRMSRQDMREEMRESEGDPQVKGRLRRLRESRARRRMLAAVPKAAVVITNPTHYAVALAYDQAQAQAAAPRLVAKGVDAMAARIRAAAEEHGVPIVASPPLARALYRLETDTEIPPEHWQAVAEIIAYVWRLRGQAGIRAGG
jgi:flagellar biosynthetic protein FlhB